MIAALMAGPLPAELAPILLGGMPINDFKHAFAVAMPVAGGKHKNQHRS